jgi:hypothetical protein
VSQLMRFEQDLDAALKSQQDRIPQSDYADH